MIEVIRDVREMHESRGEREQREASTLLLLLQERKKERAKNAVKQESLQSSDVSLRILLRNKEHESGSAGARRLYQSHSHTCTHSLVNREQSSLRLFLSFHPFISLSQLLKQLTGSTDPR